MATGVNAECETFQRRSIIFRVHRFYFAECCVGKIAATDFSPQIRVQKTITITDINYLSLWIIFKGYETGVEKL